MTARRHSNARTGTGTLFGRTAIYARISLDKVGEAAGVGLQIDACRHLAELEGWSVDEVLVDNDLSAYSGACRPEYERLLDPSLDATVFDGVTAETWDASTWTSNAPSSRCSSSTS